MLEGVLTFFLVVAVFASGVHGRNGNMAGIAIGLVLTMDILAGGQLTGASMNPARTFGPALAMGDMSYLWMYFVGPLAGGAISRFAIRSILLARRVEAAHRGGRAARQTQEITAMSFATKIFRRTWLLSVLAIGICGCAEPKKPADAKAEGKAAESASADTDAKPSEEPPAPDAATTTTADAKPAEAKPPVAR